MVRNNKKIDLKRRKTNKYKRDINNNNNGKSKKLVAKFQGPYRIKKVLENDR